MNLKTGKKFAMLFISCFLFITVAACSSAWAAETAPNFDLQNLKGAQVTLSQFKGHEPVLLYFFATWCHFCRAMQPKVAQLRKSIPDSQLAILAINVGSGDSLAKLKRYEKAYPAPYTVLYDSGSKVTRSYGIEGIPHFVLLNKNGVIKYEGTDMPSDPLSLVK